MTQSGPCITINRLQTLLLASFEYPLPLTMSAPSTTVTSQITYFVPPEDGSRAFQNTDADPTTGERPRNFKQDAHPTQVEDIRGQENSFTLDVHGFQYGTHPS